MARKIHKARPMPQMRDWDQIPVDEQNDIIEIRRIAAIGRQIDQQLREGIAIAVSVEVE